MRSTTKAMKLGLPKGKVAKLNREHKRLQNAMKHAANANQLHKLAKGLKGKRRELEAEVY